MHLYVELLWEYGDEQSCGSDAHLSEAPHAFDLLLSPLCAHPWVVFVFLLFFPFMSPLVSFF